MGLLFRAVEIKIIVSLTYPKCIQQAFLVLYNFGNCRPAYMIGDGHCSMLLTTLHLFDNINLLLERQIVSSPLRRHVR